MYVENEQGVILHFREFTDSKKILVVYTKSYGRLSLVFRKSKKSPKPKHFTLCSMNWNGKSDLKTLRGIEEIGTPILTQGRTLYCGMYLNELCMRVLPELQGNESIYDNYLETIQKLSQCESDNKLMEVLLRRFEFSLLESLGLAINFQQCVDGFQIESSPESYYSFEAESGFRKMPFDKNIISPEVMPNNVFVGEQIQNINMQKWTSLSLSSAKRLSRIALHPLLGGKPIKSRELFS